MKNKVVRMLVFFLLCTTVMLSNCDVDETIIPSGPVISISSPGIDTLTRYKSNAEGHLHYIASVYAPGGLGKVKVSVVTNEVDSLVVFVETNFINPTEFTVPELIVYFEEAHVGQPLSIVVEAIDNNNLKHSVSVPITVVASTVLVYDPLVLKAQLTDGSASTFLSSSHGIVNSAYGINNFIPIFSEDADLGYYYGKTVGASIASPLAFSTINTESEEINIAFQSLVANWGKLNATTFKNTVLTKIMFDEIRTVLEIESVYATGTSPSDVKIGLKVDEVVAFETDSTKYGGAKRGVFLVKEISDGDKDGNYNGIDDSITLEMLVVR